MNEHLKTRAQDPSLSVCLNFGEISKTRDSRASLIRLICRGFPLLCDDIFVVRLPRRRLSHRQQLINSPATTMPSCCSAFLYPQQRIFRARQTVCRLHSGPQGSHRQKYRRGSHEGSLDSQDSSATLFLLTSTMFIPEISLLLQAIDLECKTLPTTSKMQRCHKQRTKSTHLFTTAVGHVFSQYSTLCHH